MPKIISKALVAIIFVGVFLYGCSTEAPINTSPNQPKPTTPDDSQTVDVNQEFTLAPGQGATIKGTDLSVYFLDVEGDSRCASDVQCVWAGAVNITLQASKKGQPVKNSPYTFSAGGNEDIDENYNLQFLSIAPERGKQSQTIAKSDYRATFKVVSTALPVPVIEMKDPVGVIFPKESLTYSLGFPEAEGLWNPSVDDAQKADQIVQKCLATPESLADDMIKNYLDNQKSQAKQYRLDQLQQITSAYTNYKRQYVGYNGKNGHALLWINYLSFSDEEMEAYWKKGIMMVNDGGAGFFNVLVDLQDQTCLDFSINGDA